MLSQYKPVSVPIWERLGYDRPSWLKLTRPQREQAIASHHKQQELQAQDILDSHTVEVSRLSLEQQWETPYVAARPNPETIASNSFIQEIEANRSECDRYQQIERPVLQGTPKQVAWATDVREEAFKLAQRNRDRVPVAIFQRLIESIQGRQAKFWIDNRNQAPSWCNLLDAIATKSEKPTFVRHSAPILNQ